MTAAVIFDSVWKKFRLGERHTSLRDLFPSLARRAFGRGRSKELGNEEFWAVKDVAFEVGPGHALGIIGPNGAGKSTTLKLLTRILRPTRGRCEVRGRVGALIEIAAGFHPDLTGRENIFFQGAIMGMRRVEVTKKLDEIIDFAGVSAFIDTQVKRYSSGMNARLGFAIAAHLDPDVLIIDEVLSVGDMAFQERCVRRMEHFKRNGVAIVLVSHNLQAVASLCDSALVLQSGGPRFLGSADAAIKSYVELSAEAQPSYKRGKVTLLSAELINQNEKVPTVVPGQALTLRARLAIHEPIDDMTFGFMLYRSTDQLIVYDGNFLDSVIGLSGATASEVTIEFHFRANLTRGQYHIECYALNNPTNEYESRLVPAAMFAVHEDVTHRGVADLQVVVQTCSGATAGDGGLAKTKLTGSIRSAR